MKVLDFDSGEFPFKEEIAMNSKGVVRRRAKRVPTGWWDEDGAPRRFQKKRSRNKNRTHKRWADWSEGE